MVLTATAIPTDNTNMLIRELIDNDNLSIGDIVEFETDPDTVVEGRIVAETEDGYIYEFSEAGLTELTETCTHGKYYCSTDKKWKCRQGPKQSRTTSESQVDEKWSQKYKNSINCAHPKGFSQRAHCASKTNEDEGDAEGMSHLTKELLQHIVDQIGTEGAHAIVKSIEWGDGAAKELLQLIKHDLENNIELEESVRQRLDKSCWKGYKKSGTKIKGGVRVNNCVPESTNEAEYHGRDVPLGKPMKGDVKKSKVYVRNAKGNVVKVNFGDPNMRIKKNSPAHRKSFRARHHCDTDPGPRWKARYWSCRAW